MIRNTNGDLVERLSHELRNALNAVAVAQAYLDEQPARTAVEERARAVARRQTTHVARLVNDLLDLSPNPVSAAGRGGRPPREASQPDPGAAPAVGRGRTDPSERARQARAVLIVEDNADARDVLAALCRAWGYRVEVAADGVTGVARAFEYQPAVALVDIGLPGIDGYELARRIRVRVGSGMTLVAMTGFSLPEHRAQALDAGFNVFMTKPIDPDRLHALLEESIDTVGHRGSTR